MDNGTHGLQGQGYGAHRQWRTQLWGTWAMGTGVWDTWAMGYRGIGQWGIVGNWVQGLWAHGQWGTGQVMCQMSKDVKLSKRCQMSKNLTPRRFTKTINWHNEVYTLMSILTSHMMVTKTPQNVNRKYFCAILMTLISDIKIDVSMCEPNYVNMFFLSTSSIVQMFDYLTFDIFLTFWHIYLKPPQPITGLFLF